jgi:hypothetical protein
MANRTDNATEPTVHTRHVRQMLLDIVTHVRADINNISEPRAQALFETTAETLEGLAKAYEDYGEGREAAWRR